MINPKLPLREKKFFLFYFYFEDHYRYYYLYMHSMILIALHDNFAVTNFRSKLTANV